MNHEEFFRRFGYCQLRQNEHPFNEFSIDDLYEMFKQRVVAELTVDVPGTSHYGILVDPGKSKGGA